MPPRRLWPRTRHPPEREHTRAGRIAVPRRFDPAVEGTDIRLAALSSEAPVTAAVDDTRKRAFVAALATVILALVLAWTISALLRRRGEAAAREAEAVERRRTRDVRSGADVREAVALVGDALAATHDPEALLPVILSDRDRATGAAGARLVSGGSDGRPRRQALTREASR